MSEITKQALATSFKELLEKRHISKITVKDIVGICGVNRQTFYYHFRDVYDLLAYTYTYEITKYFDEKGIDFDNPDINVAIKALFYFFLENKTPILNSYDSEHRVQYEEIIRILITPVVLNKINSFSDKEDISDDMKNFVANFYVYACCGFILKWIEEGLPDRFVVHIDYYSAIINGSLETLLNKLMDASSSATNTP